MRTISRYVCEFCETEYDRQEDALRCESYGFPEPLPFLPLHTLIPAFGENGVEMAAIATVSIEAGHGEHRWMVDAEPYPAVSHNLPYDPYDWRVPARAFDPRRGCDAFRHHGTPEDIATWRRALREYGLTESDVEPWLLERVAQREAETIEVRLAVANRALASVRAEARAAVTVTPTDEEARR